MNGTKHLAEYVDGETRAHQERTANIRFKQSIIQGIGGPMVFGLVFAACGALFHLAFGAQLARLVADATATASGSAVAAAATVSLTWPLVAIGAVLVIGVGCIYFGSRLNAELSRLEQNYGARQIAKGINGTAPTIEQKPVPFPSQDKANNALDIAEGMNMAKPQVSAVQLQDKVVPLNALQKVMA